MVGTSLGSHYWAVTYRIVVRVGRFLFQPEFGQPYLLTNPHLARTLHRAHTSMQTAGDRNPTADDAKRVPIGLGKPAACIRAVCSAGSCCVLSLCVSTGSARASRAGTSIRLAPIHLAWMEPLITFSNVAPHEQGPSAQRCDAHNVHRGRSE